ncbi:MAG TPA: phosphoenolpyruvate synthase [Patescibacteria group bacterium]|nr:phosphoenolpyruvate synthase [Patescibacteria group bacterium]
MKNILAFSEISKNDIPKVGGKGANLGELKKAGVAVPNGFCVTSGAYFNFIRKNGIDKLIRELLSKIDYESTTQLGVASRRIKKSIMSSKIDPDLVKEIIKFYHQLNADFVAVRSSATAEDLPTASFAGQQITFLNINGEKELALAVQKCWSSLFEPRAIYYRGMNKFDHLKVGLSAVVQKMIQSDASGVMFTLDPATNDRAKIAIEAGFGLGEAIVSGSIIPDKYLIYKEGFRILDKKIARQTWAIKKVGDRDKRVPVARADREAQKISDQTIEKLAKIAIKIEKHYKYPQDIEWSSCDGRLYIVQSRPVTTAEKILVEREIVRAQNHRILLKGTAASIGAASGSVRILRSPQQIGQIKKGDILVAKMTDPSYVPAMKKAKAVVTDQGGQTSHAAIVSRELAIPCVVGTNFATKKLKPRQKITVDGDKGLVYEGDALVKCKEKARAKSDIKTKTRIYVNLGEPELASQIAQKSVDGVGLLRAEFIIANKGEHPRRMLEQGRGDEFVEILSTGISQIAAAFYPRPVVYRATDFKTNEYANLRGGKEFEPFEANPMIGYRGACRYLAEPDLFKLELKMLKNVRKRLNNVWLMIPFVRTPTELKKVLAMVSEAGLTKAPDFKIWMMAEIPANVLLIDDFLKQGIDGVSIGSNDLTQLVLGIDRDNAHLAAEFDEREDAVLKAIEQIIAGCKARGVTISICGQAPSVYPEICEFLVKAGITSISVNPDVIEQTRELVSKVEKK